MKIGIDATALVHSQPTGVEVVTRELLTALFAIDFEDQYILYTPARLGPEWEKYANVMVRVLPPAGWWVLRRLGPALSQDHLDIFWSPSNLLPLQLPQRSLATIHDLAFMFFPQAYSLKARLLSWLTTWRAAKTASKILAVSQQTKQDLINRFKVSADRIAVIPNALPHRSTEPPPADRTMIMEYLLAVGRVEARKNPQTLIKAFALIAKEFPNLQLVFAGSFGYQAASARQLAEQVGMADRIHFLGFVDEVTLRGLYAYAQALVFPSLYEGFGLPILEAFHYGIPVVASTAPALAEVAGDAALLVDPKDSLAWATAISRLLNQPDLRAELIEKGALRLKAFSWEDSAHQLKAVIDSLYD